MFTSTLYSIVLPLLIAAGATICLHLLGQVFFLSSHRRSRKLFEDTLWLPLRFPDGPLHGEEVEFRGTENVTLRGTFIPHRADRRKGTVLFCHELNGTQSSVSPYVDSLIEAGFDILTFDFRNHGKSDFVRQLHPTPWVTTTDMGDVRAAIDYLHRRPETGTDGVCVFGFGKGATIALCAAGSDSRVRSIVLDAPIRENRLFDKTCRDVLLKSLRLSRRRTSRFFELFLRAVLYTIACPIISAVQTWRRFVFGRWYGCRFVNPWTLARKVRQPIMIVHGHVDSSLRAEQIQALCNRMPGRPKLWFVTKKDRKSDGEITEDCSRQVARFLEEAAC